MLMRNAALHIYDWPYLCTVIDVLADACAEMGIGASIGLVVVNVSDALTGGTLGFSIDMSVYVEIIAETLAFIDLEFIVSAGAVISIGHSIDARIDMFVD